MSDISFACLPSLVNNKNCTKFALLSVCWKTKMIILSMSGCCSRATEARQRVDWSHYHFITSSCVVTLIVITVPQYHTQSEPCWPCQRGNKNTASITSHHKTIQDKDLLNEFWFLLRTENLQDILRYKQTTRVLSVVPGDIWLISEKQCFDASRVANLFVGISVLSSNFQVIIWVKICW